MYESPLVSGSLPIQHHSADYICWSFGIIGLILNQFENRVPLKPVLGVWAVLHYYITALEPRLVYSFL